MHQRLAEAVPSTDPTYRGLRDLMYNIGTLGTVPAMPRSSDTFVPLNLEGRLLQPLLLVSVTLLQLVVPSHYQRTNSATYLSSGRQAQALPVPCCRHRVPGAGGAGARPQASAPVTTRSALRHSRTHPSIPSTSRAPLAQPPHAVSRSSAKVSASVMNLRDRGSQHPRPSSPSPSQSPQPQTLFKMRRRLCRNNPLHPSNPRYSLRRVRHLQA